MYFYFVDKGNLKNIENKLLKLFKYNISSKILHELLYLGIEYSFIYNYSLSTQDFLNFIYLLILYKTKINNIYNNKYYEIHNNYTNIFFNNYYYLKVIDKMQNILNIDYYDKINPIYSNLHLFLKNKIKIKESQLQQLIGYKGYVSNIEGIIYDKPIISNYINELNIYEYILSCYGSKKGIIDTALKTADSGYLTKRLVNLTNNFIIKEIDCKSPYVFKYLCKMDVYGNSMFPNEMLQFKILQNNILNIYNGSIIYTRYTYITKYVLNKLLELNYSNYIYLNLRSLYLCTLFNTVCNYCLNYKHLYKYNLGQNIGIIASTAIGEPTTQMVLRTFHAGSSISDIKYSDDILNKYHIYKLYSYKFFNIKKIFKVIFDIKKFIKTKSNLIFLINKLLFLNKFTKFINTDLKYIIPNQFIKYNYIYNSMSKNFEYSNVYTNISVKYVNFIFKHYNNNIIQLLVKNIYNKWILYNLFTNYSYSNYIKLYNINKKGIIYNMNIDKKYSILFLIKNYMNLCSYFYYYIDTIYKNYIYKSNFYIELI